MKQLKTLTSFECDLVTGGGCSSCSYPKDKCLCQHYDGRESDNDIATGKTLISIGAIMAAVPMIPLMVSVIYEAIHERCKNKGYSQV